MKTIIQSGSKDFIIEEYQHAIKKDGDYVWVDKEQNISKHKGYVKEITFFEMLSDDIQKERYVLIKLSAGEIKALYKTIIEIEAKESDDFCDI
jgi:hypothetical protein